VENGVFVSIVVSLEETKCGRWCLHVCCGVFLEKEMTEVLRTVRGLWRRLMFYFSILCFIFLNFVLFFYTLYLWKVAFISPMVISYPNFFVLFSSSI
jgi:hypothetical protein